MNSSKLCLVFFLICPGCAGGRGAASADPVILAGQYAKKQGVNLSEYEVRSVMDSQDGTNSNVDVSQADGHAKHLLGKLRGKRYWEVCYRTIERVLGGDLCYYIDKDSKELLMVYVGQ